jgi:tetratricopeptide (TPR) repeat protein
MLRHFILALFLCGTALSVHAADAVDSNNNAVKTDATLTKPASVALPIEFSEKARREYSEKMKLLRAQMDNRQWEAAIATSQALTKVRPREPQARFIRTIALVELGKDEEAKSELLDLVIDFPELPEPRNNLAALYAKVGEWELAREQLEIAIAAAPDYAVGHANLADLYLNQALKHYSIAAQQDKNPVEKRALTGKVGELERLVKQ